MKTKENKKKNWQESILLYIVVSVVIILIGGVLLKIVNPGKKEQKVNIVGSKLEKSPVVVDSPGTVIGENIIFSAKRPYRHLAKKEIEQMEDQLKKYNRKDAIVFYQISDSEAKALASEVSEFLKSKGLEIKGPFAAMFAGDSKAKQSMFLNDEGILTFSIESQ